jgi:hypothetical protein
LPVIAYQDVLQSTGDRNINVCTLTLLLQVPLHNIVGLQDEDGGCYKVVVLLEGEPFRSGYQYTASRCTYPRLQTV